MKCLICLQAETVSGLTAIPFERGEFRLVINNVPAQVCPHCGEVYLGEDVASQLLQRAEKIFAQGEMEATVDY
jgi:YgiT-type zinc finger domain-containing protein